MKTLPLMLSCTWLATLLLAPISAAAQDDIAAAGQITLGPRPLFLVQDLDEATQRSRELKAPSVEMPFNGMTQTDYAQKMIDEYKAAGVPASDVYAQSFSLDDVLYWIDSEPEFGEQAVYLDGRYSQDDFDHADPATWSPSMAELADQGVQILAPPMWMLVAANPDAADDESRIVPSLYAERAKSAGLDLIAWTFERSGPLTEDGEWYHRTTDEVIDKEGDKLLTLDVLARDVGIIGLFSDWPATVTFYDNCVNASR